MILIKGILIPILSLIILLTPISVNFCLATESSTGMVSSSYSYEENHPNHHQTNCHNKSPIPTHHDCCNLSIESVAFYLFGLDSYPLNPVEIFFQPLEVTKLFYHPPRTHS